MLKIDEDIIIFNVLRTGEEFFEWNDLSDNNEYHFSFLIGCFPIFDFFNKKINNNLIRFSI
jgi:hypothetical protein